MKETTELNCLRCEGEIEVGYIANFVQNGAVPGAWIPGEPIQRYMLGIRAGVDVKGKAKYIINGYRCTLCGRLELFATEENTHV